MRMEETWNYVQIGSKSVAKDLLLIYIFFVFI